jgi:hypothetical protein
VQDIDGQLFAGGGIARQNGRALICREAGVPEGKNGCGLLRPMGNRELLHDDQIV